MDPATAAELLKISILALTAVNKATATFTELGELLANGHNPTDTELDQLRTNSKQAIADLKDAISKL